MNVELQNQLDAFKLKTAEDLFEHKRNEKQTRLFSNQKPGVVEISESECKKLCEKIGLEFLKGYERRVIQYRTTDETVDRYGDILRAKGADLTNYLSNPVMMLNHDYREFMIGSSIKIWIDKAAKAVPAWGLFLDDRVDSSGRADLAFKFASSGAMRACSIGFMPLEINEKLTAKDKEKLGMGKWGVEFVRWEMLEWSPVGIPANPSAMQNYFKACVTGIPFNKDDIEKAKGSELFSDVNLLDMFAEHVKGNTGKLFDIPMKLDVEEETESKTVIPHKKYPLAPEDAEWKAAAEVKAADVAKLKSMSTWFDADKADEKTSYKLPHHLAANLHTVWKGTAAAMAALLGARGGVAIPDADKKAVYNHLAAHYLEFKKPVPDFKDYEDSELEDMFKDCLEPIDPPTVIVVNPDDQKLVKHIDWSRIFKEAGITTETGPWTMSSAESGGDITFTPTEVTIKGVDDKVEKLESEITQIKESVSALTSKMDDLTKSIEALSLANGATGEEPDGDGDDIYPDEGDTLDMKPDF